MKKEGEKAYNVRGRYHAYKRMVVGYYESGELTNRGNPTYYFFLMECGHGYIEHHSAKVVLDIFQIELFYQKKAGVEILPNKMCRRCYGETKPSKELMGRFPQKIFNRFPELQRIYQEEAGNSWEE